MGFNRAVFVVLGVLAACGVQAQDQTREVDGWYAEYNTASVHYSASNKKAQEIAMECVLGDWTFAYTNALGEELNSVDDKILIVVDGVVFTTPKTTPAREQLYTAIQRAQRSIQLKTHRHGESAVFPVKGLAALFKDLSFEISPCMS